MSVRIGGVESQRTARLLEGEERAQAWKTMLQVWPNFAKYEQRTSRTIKVFALTAA